MFHPDLPLYAFGKQAIYLKEVFTHGSIKKVCVCLASKCEINLHAQQTTQTHVHVNLKDFFLKTSLHDAKKINK